MRRAYRYEVVVLLVAHEEGWGGRPLVRRPSADPYVLFRSHDLKEAQRQHRRLVRGFASHIIEPMEVAS